MKMLKNQGHQGDLFIEKVDEDYLVGLEDTVAADENGRVTVLEGEKSRHCHAFADPSKVAVFAVKTPDKGINVMYARVKEQTDIIHYHNETKQLTKEHDTITLKPGVYRLGNQRMQRSIEERILPVAD